MSVVPGQLSTGTGGQFEAGVNSRYALRPDSGGNSDCGNRNEMKLPARHAACRFNGASVALGYACADSTTARAHKTAHWLYAFAHHRTCCPAAAAPPRRPA